MKVELQLPSLEGATDWLNCEQPTSANATEATDHIRRETKGRPTLVHFWSLSSEPSITNLAQVSDLRDQRKREGLRVIAVHSPQSEAEKAQRAVHDAITRLNLTEPCALDNEHKLQGEFGDDDVLPAYYLFDIDGTIRGSFTGARGLDQADDELDRMLTELRAKLPFCPQCELFLTREAMFCAECGLPLTLPGSAGTHPYYESHYQASLPTIQLVNPDPLIGRIIEGKYQLSAQLGKGGMSVVYRARRVRIGDDVAVKILMGKFVTDDAALARFRREARAAAMLHHSNVITIHDFGEADDELVPAFIVMEFVRGTPLRDLLASEGHFPVERALRMMRGICAGVGAAHRQGVIHRDLKPENVLVVAPDDDYEFESVRVVDFGLAKLLADPDSAQNVRVMGTPFYMSPEQCMGEPLDTRSDVYSLGAMFYEMVSGKRPFGGETVSGVISKHLYDAPQPLPASLGIPRRVSAAIMQALAKDPEDRPQSATDLARLLQYAGGGSAPL